MAVEERGPVIRRLSLKFLDAGTSIGATDPSLQKELEPFLQEATEFIAMLTTLLKNARTSPSRGSQNLQSVVGETLR